MWPTDSGKYLSSTFGETRSAHFHAGLDIKTWGKEGYRVFASRDGLVQRLLVTERGYGKAIYLKHEDGTSTIYAHLQRFNKELQAIADSIRLTDYSFEMDARIDSMGIVVGQGDLIGFTGSTGIGPPHLHFEIRDSLDNPVNALKTNLTVLDNLPPVFSSLIAEPLDKNSRVDGKPFSNLSRPTKIEPGLYDFGEITLFGKAGLAVNIFDQANDVHNAYAVHTLALIQHSDTLFFERLDTFSYENKGEMFLDRIAPFGSSRRGHQRLYGKDGQQNPFYIKVEPEAQIQAADSLQTYTIIAADYFGNTSKARVSIRKDTSSHNNYTPIFGSNTKSWYWSENWASPDLKNTINLKRNNLGFPWTDDQQIIPTKDTTFILFSRITPGRAQKIISPDSRLLLRFRENTFFDTLTVASTYHAKDGNIHLSIQPEMLPAKSAFKIEFFLANDFKEGNNYRLFRIKSSNGDLSYVDSKLRGRTIHAYPDELGEFIIKADNDPPLISNFTVFKTDYGIWLAKVHVEDELTGIQSASAEFTVNGKRGIAEYDYEEELLIYYLPGFIPRTQNTAEIMVKDKAGNQTFLILEYELSSFKNL
ncbi:MAG: M23 family metallopeptidase [Balneolaceae bacterium]